jgi:superoxide dismutase
LASAFWNRYEIVCIVCLEKGATNMAKYYVALLNNLKQKLVSKCCRKLLNRILFQHNAAPHKAGTMHQKLANLHSQVLTHSAYSPDLAPSDYCFFLILKKHLKGRKILSTELVTLIVDRWFAAQPKEFLLDGLKKLEQPSHNCVELRGNI